MFKYQISSLTLFSFHVALVLRFILGVTESAFFPGALLLISKWYKRSELSQRMAILSSGSLISNAFGSLAASAILDSMEGKLGYAAWRSVTATQLNALWTPCLTTLLIGGFSFWREQQPVLSL